MKSVHKILLISGALLLSGCKTLDGAGRAIGNLTGSKLHNQFDGTYIAQSELKQYKEREDQLSGSGALLSYSGLNIPEQQVRKSHIVEAPELTDYMQNIVTSLMANWGGTSVKTKVQIINSQNFAPYADTYGTISVPLGTLENVESEDEIALLLAHELSHILLRHHERNDVMNAQKDKVTMLAKSVILANMVKDTKLVKSSGDYKLQYNASKQGQSNISKAALYNYLINGFSDSVWNTAWQRSQEDEADLLAMDLATAAGYAPRASSHNLQRLNDFQGKQDSILSKFWDQKTTALKTSVQELDLSGVSQQLDSFINEGMGTLVSATTDYFQRSHMSPDRRDVNIREYVLREYQPQSRQRVNKKTWQQLRDKKQNQDIFRGYRYAFAASSAISSGNLDEAEKLALQATSTSVRNQPGIREVMYDLRMAQNQSNKAKQNLALVNNWTHASPDFFEKKVDFEMQQHNYQQVLQFIELAESTFGNKSMFIVQKSVALANLQHIDQAISALKECQSYEAEKPTCEILLKQLEQS